MAPAQIVTPGKAHMAAGRDSSLRALDSDYD